MTPQLIKDLMPFIAIIIACTLVGLAAIIAISIALFKQEKQEEQPKPFYNLIVDTKLSLEY